MVFPSNPDEVPASLEISVFNDLIARTPIEGTSATTTTLRSKLSEDVPCMPLHSSVAYNACAR